MKFVVCEPRKSKNKNKLAKAYVQYVSRRPKPKQVKRLEKMDPEKLAKIMKRYAKCVKNMGMKRGRERGMRPAGTRPPKNDPVRKRKPFTFAGG
jgi:hypothetical protein